MFFNLFNKDKKVVKSQAELDAVALDFDGTIEIRFGTPWNPAVVKHKYINRVVARGNSSVEARENSSVVAWENSSVEARGNVQVVNCLAPSYGKIKISGNARIVYMPKNIHEFLDFHGVEHSDGKAIFYKAVHKKDNTYFSDYKNSFTYDIGKEMEQTCDPNVNEDCSFGLHIAHLQWALDYGSNWNDLAILEVEVDIKDIVLPINSNGKVRTSKMKVLREKPLSECGVYGKILEKRLENSAK